MIKKIRPHIWFPLAWLLFLQLSPPAAHANSEPDPATSPTGKNVFRDLGHATKVTVNDAAYVYSAPLRINTRSALMLGGLLAIGGALYVYDQEIYDALKRNEDHRFYKPIREAGEFFEPVGFQGFSNQYIIGAFVLGYFTGLDPVVEVTGDMLECLIISGGPKNLTMMLVGREGPSQKRGARSFDSFDGRSFPSGHSLTIVQLMAVLSHHVDSKPFSVLFYTIAGTVLLQRITSDAHWPSDVFAGATLGWFTSHAILKRTQERRLALVPTSFDHGRGLGLAFHLRF
jgi:hypothetical protein